MAFARSDISVRHDDDGIWAVNPGEGIAYHATPSGAVTLVGVDELGLNLATARIAREILRARLEADGWAMMHASAVVRDGQALLSLGPKRAGKTTAALLLSHLEDWHLLANDRILCRPADDDVEILPWPAAAALGLGLLNSLGLLTVVREHLRNGEALHPTVDPRVPAAILDGHRDALHDERGKELKTQIWPHQLADWFGLTLARHAHAGLLFFPRIDPSGAARLETDGRRLSEDDFFHAATEDRYPDFLHLAHATPANRAAARTAVGGPLGRLPRRDAVLNHDTAESVAAMRPLAKAMS